MSDLILSKFPLSAGLALPKDSEAYQDSMATMDEIARLLSDDFSPIQAWQLALDVFLKNQTVESMIIYANARNICKFKVRTNQYSDYKLMMHASKWCMLYHQSNKGNNDVLVSVKGIYIEICV